MMWVQAPTEQGTRADERRGWRLGTGAGELYKCNRMFITRSLLWNSPQPTGTPRVKENIPG